MLAHVCPNSKIGDAAARRAPSPGLPNAAPSNPLTREANRRRRKLHACNSTKSAWTLGRTAVRSCAAPSDLEFPGTSYIVFTRWNARKCRKRQGIKPPKCGRSSAGRAPPCQGGCREFESRRPLAGHCHGSGFLFEEAEATRWVGREARQRPAKPYTRVRIPYPPR